MLEAYLDWQRATLRNICAGLTAEQLASRPIASTNLSLLGLVRHMAKVERFWFRQRVAGEDVAPMYDPGAGKDTDFEDGTAADARAAIDRLDAECRAARAAAAGMSFDATVEHHGDTMSLRMVHVHMIGEYARTTATPTCCVRQSTARPAAELSPARGGRRRQP